MSWPALVIFCFLCEYVFLNNSHSHRCEVIFPCSFYLHFLMMSSIFLEEVGGRAVQHEGSHFPKQGSNLCPLQFILSSPFHMLDGLLEGHLKGYLHDCQILHIWLKCNYMQDNYTVKCFTNQAEDLEDKNYRTRDFCMFHTNASCFFFFFQFYWDNWPTALYKFKVYSIMIWFMSIMKWLSQ